ncbi:RHOMBOID-like protein [Drosera capensis]
MLSLVFVGIRLGQQFGFVRIGAIYILSGFGGSVAALLTLLFVVLLNLAVGILPHVDNFAHIGGFLAGFFIGFVLLPRPHFGWLKSGQGGRNVRRTVDAVLRSERISTLPLVPLPHLHPDCEMEMQHVIATACCNVRASIFSMILKNKY